MLSFRFVRGAACDPAPLTPSLLFSPYSLHSWTQSRRAYTARSEEQESNKGSRREREREWELDMWLGSLNFSADDLRLVSVCWTPLRSPLWAHCTPLPLSTHAPHRGLDSDSHFPAAAAAARMINNETRSPAHSSSLFLPLSRHTMEIC